MSDSSPTGTEPQTVRQLLAQSYANLGMAHAALTRGDSKYGRTHFMIRARLLKGLLSGTMSIRPLADDEKLKMFLPKACSYCGQTENLSVDHLIPSAKGGPNIGENFVWACRICNSSKGKKDMLRWWFANREEFPPLLLLRRYLKIAWTSAEAAGDLDTDVRECRQLPFVLDKIPTHYPPPDQLRLWVVSLD